MYVIVSVGVVNSLAAFFAWASMGILTYSCNDVKLTSFLGGVLNNVLNVKFVTPLADEVRLTSKFVRSFICEDL